MPCLKSKSPGRAIDRWVVISLGFDACLKGRTFAEARGGEAADEPGDVT
jgi:hypothetical protein